MGVDFYLVEELIAVLHTPLEPTTNPCYLDYVVVLREDTTGMYTPDEIVHELSTADDYNAATEAYYDTLRKTVRVPINDRIKELLRRHGVELSNVKYVAEQTSINYR